MPQSAMGCQLQAQGTTGVLKTSRLPTWIVNFGVGEAHPKLLLDAVLRGQPTWKKILCGQVIFVWIHMQLLNALQQAYLMAKM